MKMRDGAELVADIHRPDSDTKVPTILVRTTYNKDYVEKTLYSVLDIKYFVSHGYAVVLQDVRGRFESEGDYYHGIYETDDGYDTLKWIAAQQWSDGKVGMTGKSYLAAVQCAAAISGSKHLTSMFHVKAPSDYYHYCFRHKGAFWMYMLPIIFMFASSSKEALADPVIIKRLTKAFVDDGPDWLKRMPLSKGNTPLSDAPESERWLFDMLEQTVYNDFWKRVPLWQPIEYMDKYPDIPGYYVGGWYDAYREESFYTLLADRNKEPTKLLMGPWTHMDFGQILGHPLAGDVDFGPDAVLSTPDYNALQLKWFDQTIKGMDTDILDAPPVKIFVMGGGDGRKSPEGRMQHGGKWRLENEWPLLQTEYTEYYFHGNGLLSPEKPAEDKITTTFRYDPRDPVPTIGGVSYFFSGLNMDTGNLDLYVPYGPQDQRENPELFHCNTNLPLSSRHDVLVFQTSPLDEEVEVTGPLIITLWASSSAVDTDFTAKLIDVYPPNEDYIDGYAINLSDGIIRARYRNGFEKEELMSPGEIYKFTIDIFPTSNLFKQGHRIRVDISSSNFPAFDPNPNTGEEYISGGGRYIVADNTIYHNKIFLSHIMLPIIPVNN